MVLEESDHLRRYTSRIPLQGPPLIPFSRPERPESLPDIAGGHFNEPRPLVFCSTISLLNVMEIDGVHPYFGCELFPASVLLKTNRVDETAAGVPIEVKASALEANRLEVC